MPDIDLSQYYTVNEAAEKLSLNSGKKISPDYVRQLVRKGKLSHVKINDRFSVYPRYEVNDYVVEERGAKSARAAKQKAAQKNRANQFSEDTKTS